jgi:hypothetical protein
LLFKVWMLSQRVLTVFLAFPAGFWLESPGTYGG